MMPKRKYVRLSFCDDAVQVAVRARRRDFAESYQLTLRCIRALGAHPGRRGEGR